MNNAQGPGTAAAVSYLDFPTKTLLQDIGGGQCSPGSGSAAALMGLLSAQLIATVCKISAGGSDIDELGTVLSRIESSAIPELESCFQRDAEDFAKVIALRRKRDKNKQTGLPYKKIDDQALSMLDDGNALLVRIAEECLNLADDAVTVFNDGKKMVRGDSGAALSAAIAGAMSAIFVIDVNLRTLRLIGRDGNASTEILISRVHAYQAKAFECLSLFTTG